MLSERIRIEDFFNGGIYTARQKNFDNSIKLELSVIFDVEYGEVSHQINVWDMTTISIISKVSFYGDDAMQQALRMWNNWVNNLSPDGSFALGNKWF